jgi:hypothetical protein
MIGRPDPRIGVGFGVLLLLLTAMIANCQHGPQILATSHNMASSVTLPPPDLNPSRQEWRAERDLEVQSQSAYWTRVAGVAAATSVLVTFIGVLFVKWTLDQTRQATAAALEAAAAAGEANKLSRAATIAERRAWLSIEDVKLLQPTRFGADVVVLRVSVTTKNFGQTPALSADIRLESYFAKDNPEPYMTARSRFTETLRRNPIELGQMVFPHDDLTQALLWAVEPAKFTASISQRPSGEQRFEAFTLFVGVSYRVIGDDAVRMTYQSYGLPNVPVGMILSEGQTLDIPKEPFLTGHAD